MTGVCTSLERGRARLCLFTHSMFPFTDEGLLVKRVKELRQDSTLDRACLFLSFISSTLLINSQEHSFCGVSFRVLIKDP